MAPVISSRAVYPHPAVCTNIVPCSAPHSLTGRHGCCEIWGQWSDDFVFNIIYLRRNKTAKILLILLMYASRRVQILRVAGVCYQPLLDQFTMILYYIVYVVCDFRRHPSPSQFISEHPQFRDKYTRPACYFLKQFNFIQKIVYEFVIIRNI